MAVLEKNKFDKDIKQVTGGGTTPTVPDRLPYKPVHGFTTPAQPKTPTTVTPSAVKPGGGLTQVGAEGPSSSAPQTSTNPVPSVVPVTQATPPAQTPTPEQIQQAVQGAQNVSQNADKVAAVAPAPEQIQQAVQGAQNVSQPSIVYSASDLSAADRENLTPAQQAAIVDAKNAWAKAHAAGDTAGMVAAHAAAEAIRAQANYSGGTSGSGYNELPSNLPTTEQIQQAVQGAQNINQALERAEEQHKQDLVNGTGLTPNVPVTLPSQVTSNIQQAVQGAQNINQALEKAEEQHKQDLVNGTGLTPGMVTGLPTTLPKPEQGATGETVTQGSASGGSPSQPSSNLPATGGVSGGTTGGTTGGTIGGTIGGTTGGATTPTAPAGPSVPTTLPSANDLAASLKGAMSDWRDTVDKQQQAKIDYAVQQAVAELQRAEQDAQGQFKEQAESVALDERQGMDNAALYAEARGDKGGIGLAQYNEIQAAAAQNRLSVQQAQTKLSTDTARQIADLRAKGEFDKADALLEVSQTYLTQLMQLEQWAANYGLDVEKFNQSLAQWEKEYELAIEKFNESKAQHNQSLAQWEKEYELATEKFNESKAQYNQQNAIELGKAMLNAGIPVDDATLKAMNMTREQADAWMLAAQMGATQTSNSELGSFANLTEMYNALRQAGVNTEAGVIAQLRSWGVNYPGDFSEAYLDWYDSHGGDTSMVTGGGLYAETYAALDGYKAKGYTNEQMWLVIDSLPISDEEKEILVKHYGVE